MRLLLETFTALMSSERRNQKASLLPSGTGVEFRFVSFSSFKSSYTDGNRTDKSETLSSRIIRLLNRLSHVVDLV
jgi:hypothetical protein